MRIYLSYAAVDLAYAMRLEEIVDVHTVWRDEREFDNPNWWEQVVQHLDWAEAVIFLLSNDSVKTEYLLDEHLLAQKHNKQVLYVVIEPDVKLPDTFANIKTIDLSTGFTVTTTKQILDELVIASQQHTSKPSMPITKWSSQAILPDKFGGSRADRHVIEQLSQAMNMSEYDYAVYLLKQIPLNKNLLRSLPLNDMLLEASSGLEEQQALKGQTLRDTDYDAIKRLLESPTTKKYGCKALQEFQQVYPDYDPENLVAKCASDEPAAPSPIALPAPPDVPVGISTTPTKPSPKPAEKPKGLPKKNDDASGDKSNGASATVVPSQAAPVVSGVINPHDEPLVEVSAQASKNTNGTPTNKANDEDLLAKPKKKPITTPKPPVLAKSEPATDVVVVDPIDLPMTSVEKQGGVFIPKIEWVDILAGPVWIAENGQAQTDGELQSFHVDRFLMSKYPITNAQFQAFVDDPEGYTNPRWWAFSPHAQAWQESHPTPEASAFMGDNNPRENVNWYEAVAFCYWLSHRFARHITLPTQRQWRRAAQGDKALVYPWGNDFDDAKCNTKENGLAQTTPVNRYAVGASPFGVLDMTGNTWEWCLSTAAGYEVDNPLSANLPRIAQGGSYRTTHPSAASTFSMQLTPDYHHSTIGFRVVCLV